MYTEQQQANYAEYKKTRQHLNNSLAKALQGRRLTEAESKFHSDHRTIPGECFLGGIVHKSKTRKSVAYTKELKAQNELEAIIKAKSAITQTAYKKLSVMDRKAYQFVKEIQSYVKINR